jgi:hypothetical protein
MCRGKTHLLCSPLISMAEQTAMEDDAIFTPNSDWYSTRLVALRMFWEVLRHEEFKEII